MEECFFAFYSGGGMIHEKEHLELLIGKWERSLLLSEVHLCWRAGAPNSKH